jgi:drug/metabolite transporter (DMT)-like permease
VRATLKHPLWLAGLGADGVGLSLQVLALHLGALAVVQPLLVTGLLFALLLRHWGTWRVSRSEVLWALVLTGCLIAFLSLSGSISGPQRPATADRWPAVLAGLAGLAVAGSCLLAARRAIPPSSRAALIGITIGAIYAATAALIKASTDVLTRHGLLILLASWQLYAMLGLGALGLFLTQLAFQAGPLTASLPAISTVDPLLSVTIGVIVYDEHLHRGPLSGVVLLALLLLLATSVIKLGHVEATLTRGQTATSAADNNPT